MLELVRMTAHAFGFQKNRVVAVSPDHADAMIRANVATTPDVQGDANDGDSDASR
jgi:hypothetical protein